MFDCILLMAGKGERTHLSYNKIKYEVNGKPLYQYSIDAFMSVNECDKIILVVNEKEYNDFKLLENDKIKVVIGGKERQDSVKMGLISSNSEYCLIHDAARANIKKEEIINVYNATVKYNAAVLAVKENNAIKKINNGFVSESMDRNNIWIMQTPQGLRRDLLLSSLEKIDYLIYDDVQAVEDVYNIKAKIVEGRYDNIKVTTSNDLEYIEYLLKKDVKEKMYKIGHSMDTHRLVENRKLVLGGVEIPFNLGLLGHSDADCVLHAVTESILGALGLGDIGGMFSDKDPKYEGIESSYFLNEVYKIMDNAGYKINNLDVIIYIEKPVLKDYKNMMKENIAKLLHTDSKNVNVKATRGEGLGYVGEMKGISAEAVVMLVSK